MPINDSMRLLRPGRQLFIVVKFVSESWHLMIESRYRLDRYSGTTVTPDLFYCRFLPNPFEKSKFDVKGGNIK